MSTQSRIRVPLAVDTQVRVPVGPVLIPLRGVVLMAIVAPVAYALFTMNINMQIRLGVSLTLFVSAYILATPMREGVWIGTYFLYRYARLVMPTAIVRGIPYRAHVKSLRGGIHVSETRPLFASTKRIFKPLQHFAGMPKVSTVAPGVIRVTPGGARAILKVQGPTVSINHAGYVDWCNLLVHWIASCDVPAQFLTVMSHYDSQRAQIAFDQRTAGWGRTMLLDKERELAGDVASQSLGLSHYVVFAPKLCGSDGIPPQSKFSRTGQVIEASDADAERALAGAMRLAKSFGLEVETPDRDDVAQLMSHTIIGAQNAAVGGKDLQINSQHYVITTATKLPPTVDAGVVVEGLMRSRVKGVVSLHLFPVSEAVARKALDRKAKMHSFAARQGNDEIDNEVALADTSAVLAAIAQREIKPMRIALTIGLAHPERDKAIEAAERLEGIMTGSGFEIEPVTEPGFLPALALSPGCAPLGRSLHLTSDGVAVRLLPALGTPFAQNTHPLVGYNLLTGAPAYLSLWSQPNHNLVIMGSSGAGKSVATKTLVVRHIMEGVSAVVIDPDSEYQPIMKAVGGSYFELGQDAINPLAAGKLAAPDVAAGLILPVLSVMAGDEKGVVDGRPIRRLRDEDQGWLHSEVAEFFRKWRLTNGDEEAVMSDLVNFLDNDSKTRALTQTEMDRIRVLTARLRRFTQGQRAAVFNRPSTFEVGTRPVGIGLKVFAMSYGADLTPALAVVLTSILAAIDRREGRMIIVVDEAHRVTSDPDAGEVLGQLVRQARKYGAGVWMCSQRVEDFVNTDLGRTLAATASTKLILGTEEASVEAVREVFKLRPEEVAAISPIHQGRGVLLASGQRTVVSILPGTAIMVLSDTSSAVSGIGYPTPAAAG
jgi:Helicase HerA, central domain